MAETISRSLKLVISIPRGDGAPTSNIWVHATPISTELFDEHWYVLSKTFAGIYAGGLNYHTGPRVAKNMLKRICEELDVWDQVQQTLLAHINRQTTVLIPGQVPMLYEEAMAKKLLDAEEAAEVENAIVFFIVNSALLKKTMRKQYLESAANLWGAQITSLTATEFATSLRTSTEAGSSGEKAT